jgi:hypothetical protein
MGKNKILVILDSYVDDSVKSICKSFTNILLHVSYRIFSAQADRTLTHTSHEDTEQSTIEASFTLDGVTLTEPLIR